LAIVVWWYALFPTFLWGAVAVIVSWYVYRYAFAGHARFLWTYAFWIVVGMVSASHIAMGWERVALLLVWALLLGVLCASVLKLFRTWSMGVGMVYYVTLVVSTISIALLPFSTNGLHVLWAFLAYYLSSKEYVRFVLGEWNGRLRIWTGVLSLLGAQLLWVSLLLSFGFLNVSALLLIFWISAMDVFAHSFSGTLTSREVKRVVLFFGIFFVLVLIASWLSI
jgi:hypothetical protein